MTREISFTKQCAAIFPSRWLSMNVRCLSCIVLAVAWAFNASAEPHTNADPFDARYTVHGIAPSAYLGFWEYSDEVLSKAFPPISTISDKERSRSGVLGFTVTTSAALHYWEVRRLSVRIRMGSTTGEPIEVHLAWPTGVDALERTFPFEAIRQAFERSNLAPDSPEWIAQRNRLWPDPALMAAKIVTVRPLDTTKCPQLLGRLRQLRDKPPALELIPRLANLGDAPTTEYLVVTADGWGIELLWNGGPDEYDGGLSSPNQTSELGQILLKLVGDAEVCAGLERSLP